MEQAILIIEDEKDIAGFVSLELKHEGFETRVERDGRAGLELALAQNWSLILLDIMLPSMSGMEICRRVRAVSAVPIIMLTARDSVPDRVAGLDGGADDYIAKPFAIEELLARIRALLRRQSEANEEDDVLVAGEIEMNLAMHEVTRAGLPVTLTAREFELLEAFVRSKNHVLTREQLLERVWGYDFAGETNVVDVYVRYLRNKVDVPFEHPVIQTVRSVGYILKV